MVLVIRHFSCHRPIVDMHIEKVHIDGNLKALPLDILIFIDLLNYHHFSVSDRCHDIITGNGYTRWNSEEKE
jgi:hypothetical protein